ncbi:MAG: ArsR/SmtB family transcription factor [Candidatus Longimicrobiales bacterium M2_2A_002]
MFQRLSSLSDETRGRLLHVLERHELTVSELVSVLQLPQSTVSRHLRILADEGWVTTRAEGTKRYYRRTSRLEPGARRLWDVVRDSLEASPEAAQDEERALEMVAWRRTRSQEFFSTAAGRWDSLRADLFGPHPEFPALLGLLDPSWVVGDLGCGTGQLAATLAPYVARVVAVDESPDMLDAARRRLTGLEAGEVEVREGQLEGLPLEDGELDVALFSLVLHYVPSPGRALEEARRVLRPGGRVLLVEMVAHGREEYRERMGHLWQGFTEARMREWLEAAGFASVRYRSLPMDEEASGPLLFVATGEAEGRA